MSTIDNDEIRPYNPYLTARHEAGHAVAAVVLGLDLWEVRLFEEGESEHSFGHVTIRLPSPDPDVWTDVQRRDHAVMAWMGNLVHQRLKVEEPMEGCQTDLDDIASYIGFASIAEANEALHTDDPRAVLFREAARRAVMVVHAFWPAIEAVAEVLEREGMLDAEDVHLLVTEHDNVASRWLSEFLHQLDEEGA